jgi:hypothetical protein
MKERVQVWLPIAVTFAILIGGFVIGNLPLGGGGDSTPPAATAEAEVTPATSSPTRTAAPGGTARAPSPGATVRATATATATTNRTATPTPTGPRRDLARDEAAGGHTLERHVGKSDAELIARLRAEPDISAASTYPDRATAERIVGRVLERNADRIRSWVSQGERRQNLVLEITTTEVVGRTVRQGGTTVREARSAVVVLAADGRDWFVLTSYPDD